MTSALSINFAKSPPASTKHYAVLSNLKGSLGEIGNKAAQASDLEFDRLAAASKFEGKSGQFLGVVAPKNTKFDHLTFIGIAQKDISQKGVKQGGKTPTRNPWSAAGGAIFAHLTTKKSEIIAIDLRDAMSEGGLSNDDIAHLAAAMLLRAYKFDKYKSKTAQDDDKQAKDKAAKSKPVKITFVCDQPSAAKSAFARREAVAQGTILARDLIHEPPNVLHPISFSEIVKSLDETGLEIEILQQKALEKLKMGSLLAVAQGSEKPAVVAIMKWFGAKSKKDAPIALVGKGVTFDTGGISIKPAGAMDDMKGDMGGAAAVVGTMKALALRNAKVNAVGIVGLVENMPSGTAMRPGDILTAMNGKTIEVGNTDAEGRLVLADAMWYAQDRFKPKQMIDVATLTGAVMVALGQGYAGLFSNDDQMADDLLAASAQSGEKLWRLPIGPYYDKLIQSRFADLKNIGGRYGGANTAAQFLSHFTGETSWAHLDIAGMAFGAPATETNRAWASGFGVDLLDTFIANTHEPQSK